MLIRPLIRMIVVQHPAFVCFSAQIISPGSPKSNLLSFALGHRLILSLAFSLLKSHGSYHYMNFTPYPQQRWHGVTTS